MVKVSVEYCGAWGYAPRYEELAQQIKAKVPQADVTGFVGRQSSFEVIINDKLAFSKLDRGGFPDFQEMVEMVSRVESGGQMGIIEKTQSSCTIL